jgi:hypothetical protein
MRSLRVFCAKNAWWWLVLFVPTGTQGLNNFTIVEVSIAVKCFTGTGLLALCSNPQPGGVPILVAFYDIHGLQWDYSFPRPPHGDQSIKLTSKWQFCRRRCPKSTVDRDRLYLKGHGKGTFKMKSDIRDLWTENISSKSISINYVYFSGIKSLQCIW